MLVPKLLGLNFLAKAQRREGQRGMIVIEIGMNYWIKSLPFCTSFSKTARNAILSGTFQYFEHVLNSPPVERSTSQFNKKLFLNPLTSSIGHCERIQLFCHSTILNSYLFFSSIHLLRYFVLCILWCCSTWPMKCVFRCSPRFSRKVAKRAKNCLL